MADKKTKNNRPSGDVLQLEFSRSSSAKRIVDVGISIGANVKSGSGIHNDISTAAIFVGSNRNLLISNRDDTNWQYVTFGDSGVSAGSATNGIPLPPNGQIRACSSDSEYVRGSTSDLHCVEIED